MIARNGRKMNRLNLSRVEIINAEESRDWKEDEAEDSIRYPNDENFALSETKLPVFPLLPPFFYEFNYKV